MINNKSLGISVLVCCLLLITVSAFARPRTPSLRTSQALAPPQPGQEAEIICEYIIRSLPISSHHPFWSGPWPRTSLSRSAQISDWLMNECLRRFEGLTRAHQSNIEKTSFDFSSYIKQNNTSNKRNELIVLDLDESIIFQQGSAEFVSLSNIRNHNIPDLTFSIFPFGERMSLKSFIVYRPYLLELISQNIHCDFMVYTMAQKSMYVLF